MDTMEKPKRALLHDSDLSIVWAYLSATGVAIIAGVLFDRFGYRAATAFIVAIPLIVLAMVNFKIVCGASIFVLPLVPTFLLSERGANISGIKIMIGLLSLAAAAVFLSCALRPSKIRLPRLPAPLILYLVVLVLGALNGLRFFSDAPDYLRALDLIQDKRPWSYLSGAMLVPLMVISSAICAAVLTANVKDSRWLFVPVFGSAMILAAIVYFFAFKDGASLSVMARQESRKYLSDSGMHANEIGLTLNMALAIALFIFAAARNIQTKILLGCVVVTLVGAVFLTFSRGGYLGIATVVGYFLLTQRKRRALRFGLLALLCCMVLIIPDTMIERTTYEGSGRNLDEVSSGRVDEIWRPLLPSVLQSPIIGRGHGAVLWSEAIKSKTMLPVGHPHSAYLAALLDVGIIGTAVILIFLAHIWRSFRMLSIAVKSQILAAYFRGASACVPVLLVQGITDDTFMPRYTHSFLWIAYGSALGLLSTKFNRRSERYSSSSACQTILHMEKK